MACVKSALVLAGLIAICAMATWTELSRAAGSREVTKAGWFYVLWGDGPRIESPHGDEPGVSNTPTLKYFLVDDHGEWNELTLNDESGQTLGSLLEFDRKRVEVLGERLMSPDAPLKLLNVTLETTAAGEVVGSNAVIGNKRWVTILCRFADSTSITPAPVSYFNGLMASTYPGMDHYWTESSYGTINLQGGLVVGWFNLPNPRSYYIYDINNDGKVDFDFGRAAEDATAVADNDVFFPDYFGINFIFNEQLDGLSWGGGAAVVKDGINRLYGATYLPPSGFANHRLVAHEMGHGFGLPHSSGPYGATYDSQWDPMSGGGTCSQGNTNYGCIGVHTISYHKDKLGWIAPGRKYLVPYASNATINIERSGQPISGNNYLMAQVPIGVDASTFYTVEARRFSGYDNQVPGEAIVIHEVSISRGDRAARVVDADNNGDPNDAGARWTPGETFSDAARGIQVTVNSMGVNSFNVSISVTHAAPTFTIGGRVSVGSNGINGVTLSLTSNGSQIASTTSDANGNYVFANLSTGVPYIVTPSKPDYVFSPGQIAFTSLVANSTADFTGAASTNYSIGGKVSSAEGAGIGGVMLTMSGAASAQTTTDSAGNYSFGSYPAGGNYTLVPSRDGYSFNPSSSTQAVLAANWTVNFTGAQISSNTSLQFSQASYSTIEGVETALVNVTRSGYPSGVVSIDYATSDGSAGQRTDYTMASGTLSFATGETSKTLSVLIADNAHVDGNRTINLSLSNPTGATMGAPSAAVITIADNDAAAPISNPIDEAQFFVRQHYHDFLNRAPDQGGLAYWSDQITQCGTNANCINSRRIGVSAAYFVELEFQRTGSYIYNLYEASYARRPTYVQFMSDRSRVIDGPNLELSKLAFAESWVQRPEFIAKYPLALGGVQFIDLLLLTAQNASGVDLSGQRETLINNFITYGSRARIVYLLAENQTFRLAEYNKAFVLMEYFGYLRRDPDEGGYQFWLDVVNNRVPNNYRSMVCAFLTSAEYQERFSSVRTRNDTLCAEAP